MGNIVVQNTTGYSSCNDPNASNTIEITKVAINDQLTELQVEAFTCGIFTELKVWVGDAYVNDEEPISFTGDRIVVQPCDQVPPPPQCEGQDPDKSVLVFSATPEELGIDGNIIDDFIVIGLYSKRCWNTDESGDDLIIRDECDWPYPGPDPIDPEHPDDGQFVVLEEARVGVASFASIYPALIHKIMMIESGCASCSEMNEALTLDLLIKAVAIYLSVDRVEEAWDAYAKARQMSQDYEDLYAKGPTACQTFGGIGCWIIDKNFVVSINQIGSTPLQPPIPPPINP